jgi:Na+/melibiose symporter-like transporter
MAPALTQNPVERGKLAAFRGYGASIAVLALAFVVAPQIRANIENPLALLAMVFVGVANFFGLNIILAVSASQAVMSTSWLIDVCDPRHCVWHTGALLVSAPPPAATASHTARHRTSNRTRSAERG